MKTYKYLIIATDKSTLSWKSLNRKKAIIKKALDQTANGTWEVEVRYQKLKPVLNANYRISHEWYNSVSYPLFAEGNHLIYIHFTAKDWKKYKLDRRIIGANQIDRDYVGESYGWSDEHTKNDKGLNQFIQSALHEPSHELARGTGVPDLTHTYKHTLGDVSLIFKTYDMDKWQPTYQTGVQVLSRLQAFIANLKQVFMKPNLICPVPNFPVSQEYGVYDPKHYQKTKHHLGVDYATPIGTPIFAPCDGTVVALPKNADLGNWCEFRGGGYYFYFMHLQKGVVNKEVKQGDTIAFSGNTGLSTGAHVHIEAWHKSRNLAFVTENNYKNYTINPLTLWK